LHTGINSMDGQTPIGRAPNEVLLKIIEELMDADAPYRLLWPLALTCRRFAVLVQPYIWSHVVLQSDDHDLEPVWDYPGKKKRARSRKLRESLGNSTAAKSYVTRVSMMGLGEIGFADAIATLKTFPNTKRLDLESIANEGRKWDEGPDRGQRYTREKAELASPPPVCCDQVNKRPFSH
jgi:hypothetical protein